MRHAWIVLPWLVACGASPAPVATASGPGDDAVPAEPDGPAAPRVTCEADDRFTVSLAPSLRVEGRRLQLHTCAFVPATEAEPLPWMIAVNVVDRGREAPVAREDEQEAPIATRGSLSVLGGQTPWVGIRETTPWVGDGEMLLARVSLRDHDLDLAIALADGTTPEARDQLIRALGTLAIQATHPADATLWDPARALCVSEDESVALSIAVPGGAHSDPSSVGSCMLFDGDDPRSASWTMMVGPILPDAEDAELLATEPDGALRFVMRGTPSMPPVEQGTIEWLGTEARWLAVQVVLPGAGPRLVAATRVHTPRASYLAVISLAPTERARLPALLEVLATARLVE